jgi:hypothetical protein
MSESVFFQRGRNKGNERKVILSSATLLVGKAPTKQKRIKMKVRLPLTGQRMTGVPEWIVDAQTFVEKNNDTVTPDVDFKGFEINFSDDSSLLSEAKVNAQKCQMRGFVIQPSGDSEDPVVEMQFLIYAPFSDRLWRFCGQYGGEEFWARFTQVEEPEEDDSDEDEDQLELTGETEVEEETEEEAEETETE